MAPRNPLEPGVCVNCLHIYGKMGRPWMGLLEQDLGPLWKEALASNSQRKKDWSGPEEVRMLSSQGSSSQAGIVNQHSFCPRKKVKQKAGEVKGPWQRHGNRSTASWWRRGREYGSLASGLLFFCCPGAGAGADEAELSCLL